ncbi:ECF transporter S component [Pediococcus argentinicus]|uniref:ECF transporter S component n=1 Tax=Pediococcus argentinicus TaxID=480391 RepID=UPI00338DE05B
MNSKNNTRRLTIMALFFAIIIIQNYVPLLGYIPVGPLEVTTIHITVIIAGIVMGPRDGAIVGGLWGIVDLIRAWTLTSSVLGNIVMKNPLISVLPRILVGLIAGYIMVFLSKRSMQHQLAMVISAVIGSLVNTVLVLGLIYLFFHGGSTELNKINIPALLPYVLAVAGTNGIPEAIAAGIIAPLISTPLLRYTKFGQNK